MTKHCCKDCMRYTVVETCSLDDEMPYDPEQENTCLRFMLD